MAVAQPVDVAVNPNDREQRYILWGNGRIDAEGGAPPITDGPQWFDRLDQPVAVAIHITNWASGAGYLLDKQGAFHALGGAPVLGTRRDEWPSGSKAGEVQGVPYGPTHYVDWSWNPDGSGHGYVLDHYGALYAFGGASAPPRAGGRWPWPAARRLVMQWAPTKRALVLELHGGLWADFTTTTASGAPYWTGRDVARDVVIVDWGDGGSNLASGYTLDHWGGVHQFGSLAAPAFGGPYLKGADVARTLSVLSPSNPLTLWQVWSGGQQFEWTASSAPTVTAGGLVPSPASTVTTTTRPVLAWGYSDPQRDSQDEWQVAVFTQAFVNANPGVASNPWAYLWDAVVFETGRDPATRGIACPVDLPNGAYRMYVRARDTSELWSAWSSRGWTQSITLPTAPTMQPPVVNTGAATVTLTVSTASGAGDLVRFDYSDDDGATWVPVDGAEAVTRAATTTAVDRFPPQGRTRAYRAVRYSEAPRVASPPSSTVTAAIPVVGHLLHSADNPWLGGLVKVQEPLDWTRASTGGVFQGLDADYPTVVKDGSRPVAARATLNLLTMDAAAWSRLEQLALSRETLVFRGPFGDVRYCEIVGDWGQRQVRAAAMKSEATPLRHMHSTGLPLVEVAPPHKAA